MSDYLNTLFGLTGKTVLVTGGGTGIGREAALSFAKAGAKVAVIGRRVEKLAETVDAIEATGGKALAVAMDVVDPGSISAGLETITADLGIVDILINNAGVESVHTLLHTSEEEWDHVMGINLKGPWQLAKELLEGWSKESRGGNIVNIGSITGLAPQKGLASYAVSKAAILHMTKIMALEWAQYGVRVNAIAQGYYRTDMTEQFLDLPFGQKLIKNIPMRRPGNLPELMGAMIYLASDASSYVTGTTLVVDGGHLVRSL